MIYNPTVKLKAKILVALCNSVQRYEHERYSGLIADALLPLLKGMQPDEKLPIPFEAYKALLEATKVDKSKVS
jgi:hypothetical protein